MNCPNCQSESIVKNGTFRHKQRFLCQSCGKQFNDPNSTIEKQKTAQIRHPIHLYLEGLSYSKIASILDVDDSTLHRNLHEYDKHLLDIRSSQAAEEISLAEMKQFIEAKHKFRTTYPLLVIDLETGISYLTKDKPSSQNEMKNEKK